MSPDLGPAVEEHGQLVANRSSPDEHRGRVAIQSVDVNPILSEGSRVAPILLFEVRASFVSCRLPSGIFQACQHLHIAKDFPRAPARFFIALARGRLVPRLVSRLQDPPASGPPCVARALPQAPALLVP